ncbi:MAG TPA: imidazoleglycerol-phosphate dehydratase, partial [Prosthecobacter sp.]|nr:imidazoleglycerol-phosphate dehydratase [Prosthecobacter sp.]
MQITRTAKQHRKTAETDIDLELTVDGSGKADINTGVPFFDHMLTLFVKHGLFDLRVKVKGDIEVDYHHTVEDTGIVLGKCFADALGDKAGITRYGFWLLPMDETLAEVALD